MTAAAIIFDLDGTLLRLDVDIEEVRQRLGAFFAPLGVTAPFRPILNRIPAAAREAAASGRGDEAELRRAGFAILSDWEVRAAPSARAREGAGAAVRALIARGSALGIVTNNGRACVPVALAAAGLDATAFRAIVTRDDVAAPKPDPSGILHAADALGALHDVWYIGDHQIDVDAGRAARAHLPGLKVAGLRKNGPAPQAFPGADRILASLDEILSL